jgi:hypothetical protein
MNTFVLLIQNTALVLRSTIKKTRLSTGVGVLLFFRLIAKTLRVCGGFFCGGKLPFLTEISFPLWREIQLPSASGGREIEGEDFEEQRTTLSQFDVLCFSTTNSR